MTCRRSDTRLWCGTNTDPGITDARHDEWQYDAQGLTVELRRHLFYETSHSPALADLVGYQKARDIVDFCFIANPYYPTREMLEDLQHNLPNLIKSYPSSNPFMSQQNLAAVLHVDPEGCSSVTAQPN